MRLRPVLLQIHLWVGLILGLFFIALGLSGSLIVYPNLFGGGPAPIPKATGAGTPLALEQVIADARATDPQYARRPASIILPREAGDAIAISFNPQRGGADGGRGGRRGARRQAAQNPGAPGTEQLARDDARPDRGANPGEDRPPQAGRGEEGGRAQAGPPGRAPQIFVDPVTGTILGTRIQTQSPVYRIAHEIHETMGVGGSGRSFVGILGVGMLFLGLSGLYLWWPRSGQWKNAFFVRGKSRGWRLYREIHGMFGFWFWIVFLFVTLTGIPLALPQTLAWIGAGAAPGAPGGPGGPPPRFAQPQTVSVPDGASPLQLDHIIAAAEKATGAKVAGLTVPMQQGRVITVNFGEDGPRPVSVNPYTGEIIAPPASPRRAGGLNRGTIEQLHGGEPLGPVWRFLEFCVGFLPLIFVTTGFLMWLKKRGAKASAA